MSGSKRPSASVVSFRNNVEEDFTLFVVRCQNQADVWNVEKRYSNFHSMHRRLQDMGPLATSLPPKKFFGRFDPDFLEERRKGLDTYLRQTIEQSSPAQLNALMKFLQPHEDISGRSGNVGASVSKPISPVADDKAEEVAEAQYKRIVAEAESKFINVLTSDRAPHHRSLESSSKSQQYSKRLHSSIDLSQARQCGLALPTAHTADADVIKLLQTPRSCQFSVADVIASSNEISRTHQQFKIVSDDPVVLSLTSD